MSETVETIEQYISEYISYLEIERGLSQNTISAYSGDLIAFFEFLNNDNLSEISRKDFSNYTKTLARKELSPSSIERKIASLKGFFRFLSFKRYIKNNPAISIVSPKLPKRLPKVLTISEIDKILKNEKPYVFILSVAFSLMQSVYFTYMSACMSCIFFFLRVLLDNRQPKQGLIIIKQIFRIFFCVCLACFIAAPALVPAFYTLMNANKSSGVDFSLLPTKDQIENWLLGPTSFVMISGNYSWTGTNALMLSMVPFMFKRIREKGHRTPAAAFFLYYLMAVLPAWNSLMNGFSYPVGRWCYGLALFYVWAGAESLDYALQNRTGSRKTAVIWCLFLSIVVLAVYGKPTKVSPYLLMSFINIVFAFFFLFHLWKIRYIYLAAALVLNIGITFILVYLPAGGARIHQFGKIGAPETA